MPFTPGKTVCILTTVLALSWPGTAAAQRANIDAIAWLQGCWATGTGDVLIEEIWMAPRGDAMVGMSRTTRNGTLSGYEIVVIRSNSTGLTFVAHPSGQPSAAFDSAVVDDGRAVFENPDHDFPQRIAYRRVGLDSLQAWIEGDIEGTTRQVSFDYARVACPPTPDGTPR